MGKRDIVVVGASAGGMEALQRLAAALPAGFPGALLVVWHLPAGLQKTVLPDVLSRAGPVPARQAADGEPVVGGRIYVAPPDHHLLVEHGFLRVTKGPKENRFRPAVDPLFRSAAYVYGPRVTGVVLTGALDDGTSGLWTIKLRGGTTIVQDPAEALHRSMPVSAMHNVDVDHVLPVEAIAAELVRLCAESAPAAPAAPASATGKLQSEIRIAEESSALRENMSQYGALSPFTCPECHGVLTALREGRIERYRCHTGHAYSSGTLLSELSQQAEARLWDAVRAMEETVMLLSRLGEEHAVRGDPAAAEHFFGRARSTLARSESIRESALDVEALTPDRVAAAAEKGS